MEEIWLFIKDYPNYKISSWGNVISIKPSGEKILKPKINLCYSTVALYNKTGKKFWKIHRLVALHFIPNPENKPQVNHKNGVKHDNGVENLEWNTSSENIKHCFDVLGKKANKSALGKFGKDNPGSIPVIQLTMDGEFVKEWSSLAEAGRELNIFASRISLCCNKVGYAKSAGGFKWIFKKDYENTK